MLNEMKSSSAGDENSSLPTQNQTQPAQNLNQTQAPENKPQKSKRNIPFLKAFIFGFVIIVTILAFSLIAYLLVNENQNQNKQSVKTEIESPTSNSDANSDLNTYVNDEYGFSFKYPQEWTPVDAFNPESMPNLSLNLALTRFGDEKARTPIVIMRYENPNNLSIDKWQDEYNKDKAAPRTFWQSSDKKSELNNTTIYQNSKALCDPVFCHQTLIVTDGYIYQIFSAIDDMSYTQDELIENKKIYDQILSTFKFTDTSEESNTSDWKTYANSKYGYSVMYPKNTNGENWLYEEFETNTGFGPLSSKPGGYAWTINVYSDKSLEQLFSEHGRQFNDIKEDRFITNVDGRQATISTATSAQNPTWVSKIIYIENKGKIYSISNGAIDSPEFEQFYKSFKFTQ